MIFFLLYIPLSSNHYAALHDMYLEIEISGCIVHFCEFVQQKVQKIKNKSRIEKIKKKKTKYIRATTFPKLQK